MICDIIVLDGDHMKLIGVVGRLYYNRDNQEIVQLNDCLRRVMSLYEDVVLTMILPTNINSYLSDKMGNDTISKVDRDKLDFLLDKCDGFIVPGGTYWYYFDEYVIRYAIDKKKPLLSICAGFQALCSMFSKERDKFDMTKRFSDDKHYGKPDKYVHEISIMKDSLLYEMLGSDKILINSIHHDYVDFDMNELKISAMADDGVVEAVELVDHPFLVGVQWHPEYLLDDNSKKILDCFVDRL